MEQLVTKSKSVGDLVKCKIVVLLDFFVRGGSARQAFLLARDMRHRHGLDVEVWALSCYRYDGDYAEVFAAAGIPTRTLNFRFPTSAPFRLLRGAQWANELRRVIATLRKARVDVLLPFTVWPNVVAGLCYRLGGVGICIWGERHAGGARVPAPERSAARQVSHFIANSTAGSNFLANEMGVARERISLVPGGVEPHTASGRNVWRARLRLGPSEPLVVMIANVNDFRDHPTLLRAWHIVQQNWHNGDRPSLALAGYRDYYNRSYQECREIVRCHDLDRYVRFVDTIPDVPELIEASDLAVFCSRIEGMPDGVLECMAAGKAVVATDVPGIRDALGSNAGEVLVPVGDAQRFAGVMLDPLNNRARRDHLGSANRARARSEFSVSAMVDRYLGIIRGLLAAGSSESGPVLSAVSELTDESVVS
ncbi:MAG TPA: glycosyltransferase [Micropepsaceae bacterium]|nr:glycosyltransferase [Micropepsaceae bacterium]